MNNFTKRLPLILLIFLGIAGTLLGVYLTDYHSQLTTKGEAEQIIPCNISAKFNCDVVQKSRYSTIFNIPIAFLGALFYFTIAILAAAACKEKYRETNLLIIFLLGTLAVLYSLFLYYVARYIIGALCLYCITMYILNISIFMVSFLTLSLHPKQIIREKIKLIKAIPTFFKQPLKEQWLFWCCITVYTLGFLWLIIRY